MGLNIVVGIPTVGRAATLCEILKDLALQTRPPDAVFICGTKPQDVEGVAAADPNAILLEAPAGLPRQRNAIIAAAKAADIIAFFDDDFVADPSYLAVIERHMISDPSIMVATGHVSADGIGSSGLTPAEGRQIIATQYAQRDECEEVFSGYGCNMSVRTAPMHSHGVLFDERLPLYGWQEDVDLSRRLAAFGRVVRLPAATGVHLGVKHGRGSGVRLGYSQVANPIYLSQKHCGYPLKRAFVHIARNLAMNTIRSVRPEQYIDRRGRLRGNILALRDFICRRMAPERALEL
jgi:GT2 family glycosyltransferase